MRSWCAALLLCYGLLVAVVWASDPPPCPGEAPLGSLAVQTVRSQITGDPTCTSDASANKTTAVGDYMQGAGVQKTGEGDLLEEFWKPVLDPCEEPGTCTWRIKYYWKTQAAMCVSTAEVPGPFDCAKQATGQGFINVVNGNLVSSLAVAVCEGNAGQDNGGQYSTGPTRTEPFKVGEHIWCYVASWSRFNVKVMGKGTAYHTYTDPTLTVLENVLVSGTCGE